MDSNLPSDATPAGWRGLSAWNNAATFSLFALNVVVLALAAAHHTMWKDEALAWQIARGNPSLTHLLGVVHYDGHPPLWYLIMFAITRFTANPVWIKAITLIFSISASAVLLLGNSLAPWRRAGIAFSYLFLFEYGTIERNYLPGILCLLIAVTLLVHRAARARFHAIWFLAGAALFASPTLVLACALVPLWTFREALWAKEPVRLRWPVLRPDEYAALGCVALCVACSVLLVHPPVDSSLPALPQPGNPIKNKLEAIVRVGVRAASGFLAVPPWQVRFWDTTIWESTFLGTWHVTFLVGWTLLVGAVFFLRSSYVRAFYVAGCSLIAVLLVLSGRSSERHVGFFFVTFVLALLLDQVLPRNPDTTGWFGWRNYALAVVLAFQLAGGAFAIATSIWHPFSSSRLVADYIVSHGLAKEPLILEPEYDGSNILAYLRRPSAYSLEEHAWATYPLWKISLPARHVPSPEEMKQAGVHPVLVMSSPLTGTQSADLGVHLLASFDQGICGSENYYIYR